MVALSIKKGAVKLLNLTEGWNIFASMFLSTQNIKPREREGRLNTHDGKSMDAKISYLGS